jgi:hypothetical protein
MKYLRGRLLPPSTGKRPEKGYQAIFRRISIVFSIIYKTQLQRKAPHLHPATLSKQIRENPSINLEINPKMAFFLIFSDFAALLEAGGFGLEVLRVQPPQLGL